MGKFFLEKIWENKIGKIWENKKSKKSMKISEIKLENISGFSCYSFEVRTPGEILVDVPQVFVVENESGGFEVTTFVAGECMGNKHFETEDDAEIAAMAAVYALKKSFQK